MTRKRIRLTIEQKRLNNCWDQLPLVHVLEFQDSLSAETLSLPGMLEAITKMSLSWHQSHISKATVINWRNMYPLCCWCKRWRSCSPAEEIRLRETYLWERFFSKAKKRTPLALDNWCVGETLFVTICHWSEGIDELHPNLFWMRQLWSYPAEEGARFTLRVFQPPCKFYFCTRRQGNQSVVRLLVHL